VSDAAKQGVLMEENQKYESVVSDRFA